MLLKEAELRVDDLTTAVVHVSYTTSSEVKVIHIALIDFLFHTNRKISLEKSPSPPDQCQYTSSYTPAPPLTQQQSHENNWARGAVVQILIMVTAITRFGE